MPIKQLSPTRPYSVTLKKAAVQEFMFEMEEGATITVSPTSDHPESGPVYVEIVSEFQRKAGSGQQSLDVKGKGTKFFALQALNGSVDVKVTVRLNKTILGRIRSWLGR